MSRSTPAPTFTCDHCGRPVGLHDAQCPGCGKRFDAVRCPKCGHQGSPAAFEKGCPSCHYLSPTPPAPRSAPRRSRTALFTPLMSVLLALLALAILVSWWLRPHG